jgi:hypothetical protein
MDLKYTEYTIFYITKHLTVSSGADLGDQGVS